MILFRNRLVFGLIKKLIVSLCSAVYKIISLLNLQFTLLIAMVGLLMFLTGLFENRLWLIVFYFALIFSVIFSILGTIKKLLGLGKKVDRKKNIQIVEPSEGESVAQNEESDYPRYYRVRCNQNQLMAEFSDRYELYEKRNGEWVMLRTDKK